MGPSNEQDAAGAGVDEGASGGERGGSCAAVRALALDGHACNQGAGGNLGPALSVLRANHAALGGYAVKTILDTFFALRRPCGNCPFRKTGAIELEDGRLASIVEGLVSGETTTFHCHKTVHNDRTGGDWDDDGNYRASGQESMCAGAIIYLEKSRHPTVAMKLGRHFGMYDPAQLAASYPDVIDPEGLLIDDDERSRRDDTVDGNSGGA
jgi:hypothetical protein